MGANKCFRSNVKYSPPRVSIKYSCFFLAFSVNKNPRQDMHDYAYI